MRYHSREIADSIVRVRLVHLILHGQVRRQIDPPVLKHYMDCRYSWNTYDHIEDEEADGEENSCEQVDPTALLLVADVPEIVPPAHQSSPQQSRSVVALQF